MSAGDDHARPTLRDVADSLRALSAAARRHHDLDLSRLAAQLEHDADILERAADEIDDALERLSGLEARPAVRPTIDELLSGGDPQPPAGDTAPAQVAHRWEPCPDCAAPVITAPTRAGDTVILDRDVIPSDTVAPSQWWRIDPAGYAHPANPGRRTPAVHTRHHDTCTHRRRG